ncbi:MAG: hypothetical protein CMM46_08135 [Rhodospirillaceae bacterium]|nr:hypothetical protein [Rhodospirillaceae bacterium]|tara:strand:- start:8939 stop:9166 length:228 start_codon:yes stop_codon:yes gene_type:complete
MSNSSSEQARETGLTADAFAAMGTPNLAYIALVVTEEMRGYGIHSAEGQLLAVLGSRDVAFAAARQNNLDPVSVH